ncbi:unnamed protein product [Closterium sp. NIES-65]|nr:unnamed protein product [Closterium sp. NIES-65]
MPTNSDRFVTRHASLTAISVLLAALLAANGSVTPVAAQSYNCSANPAVASVTPKYANRFFRVISTISNLYPIQNWAADTRLQPVLTPLRTEGRCKASWAITAVSAVEMAYALVADSVPSMAPPQRLSLQQVLDCSYSTSSNCIDGGWLTAAALDYMVDATRQWGLFPIWLFSMGLFPMGLFPISSNCVDGGWPTAALDYMVDATRQWGGLAAETPFFPYLQRQSRCVRRKATTIGITGYDQVDFYSWFGLLLAVNVDFYGWFGLLLAVNVSLAVNASLAVNVDFYGWFGLLLAVNVSLAVNASLAVNTQPTIAFVQGSYPSFQTYTQVREALYGVCFEPTQKQSPLLPDALSEGIYSDPGCAAAGVVDHSVLVMGWRERYFWVDYKMVQEGTYSDAGCAVAGVVDHSVVVMGYSITADSAFWILRNSWGATWGMQGYMQMAFEGGVGICGIHSVPALYPIIKTDVCSLQDDNPCAVGTCINDNAGGFFCLCPPGFDQGYRPNGAYTCVPTSNPSYTVVFPIDIDCPLVYQLYGLTEEAFLAQNPNLSMDHCVTIPKSTYASVLPPLMGSSMDHCVTIPKNTEVSVLPPLMGSVQCGLFYSWTANDTCKGVAGLFSLTVAGFLRLNPGINCTSKTAWNAPTVNQQVRFDLPLGAQLCMAIGYGADLLGAQLCMALGYGADLPLGAQLCMALGYGADLPAPRQRGRPTHVHGMLCVALGNGADLPMCTAWYTVKAGDTCADIMADHSLNDTTFFALNPGLGCDSLFPSVGGSLFPSFSGSGRGWSGDGVQVSSGVR